MDNPRYERYLTCPPHKPGKIASRLRHISNDLAHKVGLRQLRPAVIGVAAILLAVAAGLGLWRSGIFSTAKEPSLPVATRPAAKPAETTVTVHVVVDQQSAPTPAPAPAPATGAPTPATGGKIDLNTADAAALDTLPGVGPATANKIIADRAANGPFVSPEDLMRVAGIGQKKYDALKDLIVVR